MGNVSIKNSNETGIKYAPNCASADSANMSPSFPETFPWDIQADWRKELVAKESDNSSISRSKSISRVETRQLEELLDSCDVRTWESDSGFSPHEWKPTRSKQLLVFAENLSARTSSLPFPRQRESRFERQKEILELKMGDCYFEPGVFCAADTYFHTLWTTLGKSASLDILASIVNENPDSPPLLEGVLHILSGFSYDEIYPIGLTIGLACAFNESPDVLDLVISCFGDWGDPEAIHILKSMRLSNYAWLSNFRDLVVSKLEQKC